MQKLQAEKLSIFALKNWNKNKMKSLLNTNKKYLRVKYKLRINQHFYHKVKAKMLKRKEAISYQVT